MTIFLILFLFLFLISAIYVYFSVHSNSIPGLAGSMFTLGFSLAAFLEQAIRH